MVDTTVTDDPTADGSHPCESVNQYGVLSDAVQIDIIPPMVDGGPLHGSDSRTLYVSLRLTDSSGAFNVALADSHVAYVTEQGHFGYSLDLAGTFIGRLTDGADLHDQIHMYWTDLVTDSATFSDSAVGDRPPTLLVESGELADAVGPFRITSGLTEKGKQFSEQLQAAKLILLTDSSGAFSDATFPVVPSFEELLDSGVLTDSVIQVALTGASAVDAAILADDTQTQVHTFPLLADDGVLGDFADSGVGGAWSTSTDTFAMSRWETDGVNSVAEIDGKLYVATDTGLYRMDAGAGAVDASIRGGLTDLGDSHLKHFSDFYAWYASNGTLRVSVGYIPAGVEKSVSYDLPVRTANVATPNRTKLGRGIRTSYLRLTVENVKGSDFTLYDRRLQSYPASRRV